MTAAVKEVLAYVKGKRKMLKVLIDESIGSDGKSTYLFQLLDITSRAGLEAALEGGRQLPEQITEPLLHELFSGLLPIIFYVLLDEGLRSYYGWDEETLCSRFVESFLRIHGGY